MEKLKTLAAITVGALVLSTAYAIGVKGGQDDVAVDSGVDGSSRYVVHGDRGEFLLKDDDLVVKASWRGEFELDPLGADIESLDKKFEISKKSDGVEQRVIFKRDKDDIERFYYIDDEKQESSPETDAAIKELLIVYLRASGRKAEERVAAFLNQGGPDAVLEEMTYLGGDHSVRRYTEALTEEADLSEQQLTTLLTLVNNIEGDHDLRTALESIIEHEEISSELTPALIGAASGIESDHDLRKLVQAFAERPLNDESMDLALGLYERLESDYDLRVAADALLENDSFDSPKAARLLSVAAARIDSDRDMRLILTETAPLFSADQEMTTAWLDAFTTLDSDRDQRISIEEVAEQGGHPSAAWKSLIEATTDIDSDHDHRLALEAIAGEIEEDAELLDAYRISARAIDSDRDRENALEAIGDSEDQ